MTRPWQQAAPLLCLEWVLLIIILPAIVPDIVVPPNYFLDHVFGHPEPLEQARYLGGSALALLYMLWDPPPDLTMQCLALGAIWYLLWLDQNLFGIRMFTHARLVAAVVVGPVVYIGLRRFRA